MTTTVSQVQSSGRAAAGMVLHPEVARRCPAAAQGPLMWRRRCVGGRIRPARPWQRWKPPVATARRAAAAEPGVSTGVPTRGGGSAWGGAAGSLPGLACRQGPHLSRPPPRRPPDYSISNFNRRLPNKHSMKQVGGRCRACGMQQGPRVDGRCTSGLGPAARCPQSKTCKPTPLPPPPPGLQIFLDAIGVPTDSPRRAAQQGIEWVGAPGSQAAGRRSVCVRLAAPGLWYVAHATPCCLKSTPPRRALPLLWLEQAYKLNPGTAQEVDLVLLDERYERAPLPCEIRDDWCASERAAGWCGWVWVGGGGWG